MPQCPREAILARLLDDHVEALALTVGLIGALARLEVESVGAGPFGRVGPHLGDGHIEDLVAVGHAREALEPERGGARCCLLCLGLHIDVGEHAVGHDVEEPEGGEDLLEGQFDGGDLVDLGGDGVGAEHHVANAVGEGVEDLPGDVVRVVGRRVGLHPGAEVALRADLGAGEGMEDAGTDLDELVVAHHLYDDADDVAREARKQRIDLGLRGGSEEGRELADGHRGGAVARGGVEYAVCVGVDLIFEDGVGGEVADAGGCDERAGRVAGGLVGGRDALRLVALLEGVGSAENGTVAADLEATLRAGQVGKEVFAGARGGKAVSIGCGCGERGPSAPGLGCCGGRCGGDKEAAAAHEHARLSAGQGVARRAPRRRSSRARGAMRSSGVAAGLAQPI